MGYHTIQWGSCGRFMGGGAEATSESEKNGERREKALSFTKGYSASTQGVLNSASVVVMLQFGLLIITFPAVITWSLTAGQCKCLNANIYPFGLL